MFDQFKFAPHLNSVRPKQSIPDTADATKLQSSRTQEQSSHIPVK